MKTLIKSYIEERKKRERDAYDAVYNSALQDLSQNLDPILELMEKRLLEEVGNLPKHQNRKGMDGKIDAPEIWESDVNSAINKLFTK